MLEVNAIFDQQVEGKIEGEMKVHFMRIRDKRLTEIRDGDYKQGEML